jgi:hypothetical protein
VRLLDRVEVAEQHGGGEAGRHERDRVEVGGGLGIRTVQRQRDRFDGRGGDDARRQRQAREVFEGRRHRRLPVAEVGADRDDRDVSAESGGHVVGEALREAAVHAGTPSRARRIVTLTSSNGTVMGACGLWIVTSTASTRARERARSAMRWATVSRRSGLAGEHRGDLVGELAVVDGVGDVVAERRRRARAPAPRRR